jgi:14-3-3 protein epsilon
VSVVSLESVSGVSISDRQSIEFGAEMTSEREENVCMAKVAEEAERYEDMMEAMVKVAKTSDTAELTAEERGMMLVAFQHVVGARRASLRVISSIQEKEEGKGNHDRVAMIEEFRSNVETEMRTLCDRVFLLLDSTLIPNAFTPESKVFYHKMKGDYHRYMVEAKMDHDLWKETTDTALHAYESALEISTRALSPLHPLRLGLACNFSIFYKYILNSHHQAHTLARRAYDEAIAELTTAGFLSPSSRESSVIMNQLRDNLAAWGSPLYSGY